MIIASESTGLCNFLNIFLNSLTFASDTSNLKNGVFSGLGKKTVAVEGNFVMAHPAIAATHYWPGECWYFGVLIIPRVASYARDSLSVNVPHSRSLKNL